MEYFNNPRVLETTEKADEYKKAQNLPNLMGRSYLAPNSFRGTVFQAPVTNTSKEPFSHGNPDTYLRKIGAGKLWPMPKVVDEKEAKAMTDFWRNKAQDAYKEFAPVALNFADIFNEGFHWLFEAESAVGTVGDNGDGGENQLPYNLSGLVGRAWEAVMSRDEFKDFFGAETKLPEHAGAGFDAWTQAFQRVALHQSANRVGLEKQVTEVPVAVYNFTPSKSGSQPDFTDYEEHCKNNKLAYLIPWLNLEDLASPENVANMILSRAMHAPPTFARSDWNAMQVGRSGRLLLEPYCDSCFMDFYKPPMILNNSPNIDCFTGAKSHGILIERPSMSDILRKHKTSHNLGQIFGWGDGLLILQAQATILRFCSEITKLMVRCHVTDESGRARPGLDVLAGKPKFLSLHPSFPVKFKIPGVPWDLNSFKVACNVFWHRNEPRSSPRSSSGSRKSRERSSTEATNRFFSEKAKSFPDWFSFQEDQMKQAFLTDSIRSGMAEINSLPFQHVSPKFDPIKNLQNPAWSIVPLTVVCAMQTSAHAFARMVELFLVNHWGRIPSADDKQELAHFTSTDIAAKRLLANDAIRRLLRHCMFGLLIRSEWTKTVSHFTSEPSDPGHLATMSRRLLHLRQFAVVAWTMLRGQGLLHGNRMNAELCERAAARDDSNARRMLPNGLMRGRVPSLARYIGSTTEPGNNSSEQEEDTFKDFFKLFELGPPETGYGFPSMDLLAQKLDHSFTACHEPNEGLDGVYDAFVKGELHNLRLMTNQISLMERSVNAEIQRGRIHVRPRDFEAEVQRNRVWKFIDKFDKFNFEDYVTKETLAAIHSRVLGIRDTNAADMEIETTLGQASNFVLAFLIELDERMFADDADVMVLYRNMVDQQLKNPGEEYAVSAALIFADGGSGENDDPWRPNLHWGEIHTPDQQDDDLMDLGRMDLSDSSDDSDDNGPPDGMDKNTKPAKKDDPRVKIPDKKIKKNTNHKPPRSPNWEKTPDSRKPKPKKNDTLNLDEAVAGGKTRSRELRKKHIVTAERVFADESGSVHMKQLRSLLSRMGFYITEAAGSVFTIHWTPAVLLPNLGNHTSYPLHGPHGGDGPYWHGTDVARLARNLRGMGITWELIEQTYFGPGGPNARMVLTLGWNTSEDDWSVDGDKSEEEEEEMESPATEVLEAVEVNGVGKRRREDEENDKEEEELRGFRKIRSV